MKRSSQKQCIVGVDLGGTKILSVVYDDQFRPLGQAKIKTKAAEGASAVLERVCESVCMALNESNVPLSCVSTIGVGCPGPLDLRQGVVLTAPNLGWRQVPLKRLLEKKLRRPVTLVNDVDAGVYAEYRFGAAQGAHCVLGVFPGTGVGGGCVYRGQLIQGRMRSCMEIGHLIVEPNGRLCGCGQRGCLETVASRLAIAADAAIAVIRGQAPNLKKETGADLSEIRSGALSRAIKAGDTIVKEIVCYAAYRLGVALAGVVNLLGPDVVVLGGGLVEAMEALFLREVRKAIKAHALPALQDDLRIVAARLGDYATVLGAAAWAASVKGDSGASTRLA